MKRRICPQVFDQKLSNFRNYLLLGSNGFLYICVCVSDCLLNFKRNHLQLFSSCTFDYTREVPEKMEFHSVWKSTLDSLGAKIQIRVNVQIQNSFGIGNGLFFCQQNATKDTNYLKMVFFWPSTMLLRYAILTAKASVISFLFSSEPTFICLIIQGLTFAGNL